eukprot:CAMPEP_0180371298 /NCGR_PEP_ID=MMETSP0989-20121125/19720_1 /TAXON_ID=697907 /ORGANISM="non described non described, Strain CCMP2293" /LENGTH=63 /DNA_ID=CAMNT_0022367263 /DNA_START=445 /DNA_END=633 /DNA_ORIENTATION=+
MTPLEGNTVRFEDDDEAACGLEQGLGGVRLAGPPGALVRGVHQRGHATDGFFRRLAEVGHEIV